MSIQIYSAIWPYILKFYALKMLWIFVFVIFCISSFLMIMYKSRKEVLKKSVLPNDAVENIHGKVRDLKDNLKYKEAESRISNRKIKKNSANKKPSSQNLQKILVRDLKRDVIKTEEELAKLEYEIMSLTKKTEFIKDDISKQQEEYNKCIKVFLNE